MPHQPMVSPFAAFSVVVVTCRCLAIVLIFLTVTDEVQLGLKMMDLLSAAHVSSSGALFSIDYIRHKYQGNEFPFEQQDNATRFSQCK